MSSPSLHSSSAEHREWVGKGHECLACVSLPMQSNKRVRGETHLYPTADEVYKRLQPWYERTKSNVVQTFKAEIDRFMLNPENHKGTKIRVYFATCHRLREILDQVVVELEQHGYVVEIIEFDDGYEVFLGYYYDADDVE